ncbi:MAG: hypothetical protein AAF357_17235, partial [Verrucomicrobiota bacterium]
DRALLETLFAPTLTQGESTVPISAEESGYAIYHFGTDVEPKPLTLDQAREQISAALLSRESNTAASEAADQARGLLLEALEGGKDFTEAVASAELEVEQLPNFSLASPPAETADASRFAEAVSELKEGDLSEVIELSGGRGFAMVYVDNITLYKDEERDTMERQLASSRVLQLQGTMFDAWLNQRRRESSSSSAGRAVADQPIEQL